MIRNAIVSGMLGLASCLPSYAATTHWVTEIKWEPVFYAPMAPQEYFSGYASSVDIARDSIAGDSIRVEAWVRYIWAGRAVLPGKDQKPGEKAIGEIRHLTVDCRQRAIRTNQLFYMDAWPLKIIPPEMPAADSAEWHEVFKNYGKFGKRVAVDDDSPGSVGSPHRLDSLLVTGLCRQDGEIQRRLNNREEERRDES